MSGRSAPRMLKTCALLALCLSGCYSATGLGRARTLGRGHVELGGNVELTSNSGTLNQQTSAPWAHLGAVIRVGVHDRVDVGARGSFAAFDGVDSVSVWLDPKFQLIRSANPSRGADLALVTSVGWHQVRLGGTPWHLPQGAIALLLGVNFGAHQLVLGARGGYQALIGTSMETQHIGWGAVSIGGAFRAERWDLVPELVLGWAPGVTFNGERSTDRRTGAGQAQIGFSWVHRW